MRRSAYLAAAFAVGGALGAALLVGCSNDPPPIEEAKAAPKTNGEMVEAGPSGPAPEKSDPAAQALVTEALKAHTGGKPELLAKLKSVRFTREGRGTFLGPAPVAHTWHVTAAWPDKIHFRGEFPGQMITLCRTGEAGWRAVMPGVPGKEPMSQPDALDMKIDSSGEWLLLLFPLTEPGTIVASAPETIVNEKPAVGVRVWVPGVTPGVYYFDKETKLLTRLTFEGREQRKPVTKEISVLTRKVYAGVTLPEKIAYRAGGKLIADWTMTALEPQSSIDPKLFEGP